MDLKIFIQILYLIGFLTFVIWMSGRECSFCDTYKSIFKDDIEGKVIKVYDKFDKDGGRMVGHIIVKNKDDSLIDLKYIYNEDVFIGDSVYKSNNTLKFAIYRKDSLINSSDMNCNCSYVIK